MVEDQDKQGHRCQVLVDSVVLGVVTGPGVVVMAVTVTGVLGVVLVELGVPTGTGVV